MNTVKYLILLIFGLIVCSCAHHRAVDAPSTPREPSTAAFAPEITVEREGGTDEFADTVIHRVKSYSSNFLKCYKDYVGDPQEPFEYKEFQIEFNVDTDRGRVDVEPDSRLEQIENAKYTSADACMRDVLARIPFKKFGTAHFSLTIKF